MEKKTKKKGIRNYVILTVVFVVVVVFVLYLCELYRVYDEEQKMTPVISGSLQEIYSDDLEFYLMDNPTILLYMCTSNDDTCRNFEKSFKKLLNKKDYGNSIIYLNLTDVNQEQFVKQFNEKYHFKIQLTTHYPAFVLFEEGRVVSVLQGSKKKALTMSKVQNFFEINQIGEGE